MAMEALPEQFHTARVCASDLHEHLCRRGGQASGIRNEAYARLEDAI